MSVCGCVATSMGNAIAPVPVAPAPQPVAPVPVPVGAMGARQAVGEGEFAAIRSTVASASFSSDKLGALQLASRGRFFLVEQAGDLIDLFAHSDDKLKALVMLEPLLVDPNNAFRLLERFDFAGDKERARRILAH
jgi:hypothetical protein